MSHAEPRTGKELFQATRPFATEQPWRSWKHLLITVFLLAVVLSSVLWMESLAGRMAASLVSGLLILRLFVIYHDQQHHAIFSHSRLAGGFMWLFGVWVLSPGSIWRESHNHHHNHNSRLRGSQIGSFPIMTAEGYRRSPRRVRAGYLAGRHPITLLLGYAFIFLWGMCARPFLSRPRKHADCLLALVLHAALAVLLVTKFGWVSWLLFQTLPTLVACAAGSYLFYVQHNFPDVVFREKGSWTYEAAALESSGYLKLSAFANWFTGNIGYHHVHHLNSRIPFYRLPEAMREIPELQQPRTTTLTLADIRRCLSLKVWDAGLQRMTGVGR